MVYICHPVFGETGNHAGIYKVVKISHSCAASASPLPCPVYHGLSVGGDIRAGCRGGEGRGHQSKGRGRGGVRGKRVEGHRTYRHAL